MSYADIPPGQWEFDIALGAHWKKSSERCWILVTGEGYYAARVVGDMPPQLMPQVDPSPSGPGEGS